MGALTLTQEQFEQVATEVVGSLVAEATLVMQRKLQKAGVVLTGDLLNSLHHQSVVVGRELYAEFAIGFAGYGRFKDMRQLLYEKMPPIEVMEDFVEKVGLENFKYVPGYLLNAKYRVLHIPDKRAINRIAWGIASSRIFVAKIRHYKRSAFYNSTRGKLVYEAGYRIIDALPQPILQALKGQLEGN